MSLAERVEFPFLKRQMLPIEAPRANVLGVGVSAINLAEAVNLIESSLATGQRRYVCVTGVHGVMEAQRDPCFRQILNSSFITTPDGMPTVWVGRTQGFKNMSRVYGPDLMLKVCESTCAKGHTHFFYGGKSGVAEKLASGLISRFPSLKVVGVFTPPFGPLGPSEESRLLAAVSASKPDIVWVGLSTPKQERFMAEYIRKLPVHLMVGVGAAFDIHAGLVRDAPDWVKAGGLQWLHRLFQEPSRLWRRYLTNNPAFLWKVAVQLTGLSKYTLD